MLGLDGSHVLAVLAMAASPISELRGAIPTAILVFRFPWYHAFFLAIIGNLLPVPLILLISGNIARRLGNISIWARLHRRLSEPAMRRGKIIEKYGGIGLALFIAVPLPMTGAWTGAFIAPLLGLRFKHALLTAFVGILIAGVIVTAATLLGWSILGLRESLAILPAS